MMMLQRSQMVALPVSGFVWGLVTGLVLTRAVGFKQALAVGCMLGFLLCITAAWSAYRSDGAARHAVGNGLFYALAAAPFLGGACLVLAQMAGLDGWALPVWFLGVATVLVSALGPAWQTHARLAAEGDAGPWARKHLDLRAGVLLPGALSAAESPRPAMTPWQIGALAVNLPLLWRLQGGGDTGLMALVVMVMVIAMVWVGVGQVGPALGAGWFLLDIERRTSQRLRNPEWAEVQAMRREHWLARRFMRET